MDSSSSPGCSTYDPVPCWRPGKTVKDGSGPGTPAPMWETSRRLEALLISDWSSCILLWPFGKWINELEALSVSPLCDSAFPVKTKKKEGRYVGVVWEVNKRPLIQWPEKVGSGSKNHDKLSLALTCKRLISWKYRLELDCKGCSLTTALCPADDLLPENRFLRVFLEKILCLKDFMEKEDEREIFYPLVKSLNGCSGWGWVRLGA